MYLSRSMNVNSCLYYMTFWKPRSVFVCYRVSTSLMEVGFDLLILFVCGSQASIVFEWKIECVFQVLKELINLALLGLRPFIFTLCRCSIADHLTTVTEKASLTLILHLDRGFFISLLLCMFFQD